MTMLRPPPRPTPPRRRDSPVWMAIVAGALLAGLALWSMVGEASGHGEAEWIAREGWRDINGQSCCNPTDCKRVPTSDVYERDDGSFTYLPTGEHIPRNETRPSPDQNFWRCHWHVQGEQRTRPLCFWRPVPPS